MRAGMDYCTCTLHFAIISTRLTEKFDEKGPEKEASGPISLSPPCGMHEALMRGHLEMKIVVDWVGILQIPSLKEAALPKVTYLCPSFPSRARRQTDCHDALKLHS